MTRRRYKPLIRLVREAFTFAQSLGIPNLLQPRLAKEIIIADILGHEVIISKGGADAHDPANPTISYEYLSCLEGKTGQLDRMVRSPDDERQESLDRIRRNDKIYFAVFYKANQIEVKTIYELETDIVLAEALERWIVVRTVFRMSVSLRDGQGPTDGLSFPTLTVWKANSAQFTNTHGLRSAISAA